MSKWILAMVGVLALSLLAGCTPKEPEPAATPAGALAGAAGADAGGKPNTAAPMKPGPNPP